MDLSQLLGSDLGKQVIGGISNKANTTETETSSVINTAAPILLGMLKKNAETQQGASSLLDALNKHDGGLLNNLGGFLNSGDTTDGQGILGHILGGQKNQVEKAISNKTGVSASQVSTILALLAPIIMGKLGSQTKAGNVNTGGGLGTILGGLLGNSDSSDILSSVLGGALGGSPTKKKDGLGGLLGGLFGK